MLLSVAALLPRTLAAAAVLGVAVIHASSAKDCGDGVAQANKPHQSQGRGNEILKSELAFTQ